MLNPTKTDAKSLMEGEPLFSKHPPTGGGLSTTVAPTRKDFFETRLSQSLARGLGQEYASKVEVEGRLLGSFGGKADVLAALRSERHELLTKRRVGAMTTEDSIQLSEVELALNRLQRQEIESETHKNDSLYEELNAAIKALMAK